MRREIELDPVLSQLPIVSLAGPSANSILPIDRPDEATLPLVIGIAADPALTAAETKGADESIVKILADLRARYAATPLVLLLQLPATLRHLADRLAHSFAADCIELEHHFAPASADRDEDIPRRAAFLADHSHLVIVVSANREPAPTELVGQIIDFRLHGIPDRHNGRPLQLDSFGLGNVYQIVTGGTEGSTSALLRPQDESLTGNEELDDPAAWDYLDRFNADVAGHMRQRPRSQPARARPLAWPIDIAWLEGRFAVADALAIRFQRASYRTLFGLLGLGLLAALALQLAGIVAFATRCYAMSIVLAYGWHLWAYWRSYERRFYDYRALAEGLRVQMYWSAAGITSCAADHYLRRQRDEFEWIRQALRTWTLIASKHGPKSSPSKTALQHGFRQVCEQWVDDQGSYYRRAGARQHALGQRLKRGGKVLLALGLLLAGAKSLFHDNLILNVAMGVAPAVAALLYMYAQTRAFLEQAQQYDRMSRLFGAARIRLRRVMEEGDLGTFQHLLVDLGKEALRENGDWVLLHRERPIAFGSANTWILAGSWLFRVLSRRRRQQDSRKSTAGMPRESRAA